MFSSRRHPDSEVLLALLDGELGPLASWRMRKHVESCWICRGRMVDVQNTIAEAGRALEERRAGFDRTALARARWNFRHAAAQIEAEARREPAPRAPWALNTGLLGAAALACVLVWHSWPLLQPASAPEMAPPPAALLATVQARELAPIPVVREETFTVELATQDSPSVVRRLLVLSAPDAGLHSARWLDERGTLRNAVFVEDSETGAVYSASRGLRRLHLARPASYTTLFETVAITNPATIDKLEAAVLNWVQGQVWEPVSLTREVMEFCSKSGAKAIVRTQGSSQVWTAEAMAGGALVHLTLEAESGNTPKLMQISWRSASGQGVLRLRREQRRDYPALAGAPVWLRASALGYASRASAVMDESADVRESIVHSRQDLLGAEVEAVAALHRAGLWQRDRVRVTDGVAAVHIAGTLQDEAERKRVETALAGMPRSGLMTWEWRFPEPADGEPEIAPPGQQVGQTSHPAPAEGWLRVRMGVGSRASEREMFSRMSLMVASAQDLLADAWAIEHLAEQFPPARQAALSPEDHELLLAVVNEHTFSARKRLSQLNAALELTLPTDTSSQSAAVTWQHGAVRFRDSSQRLCDLVLRLFSSSNSPAAGPRNPEESELPSLLWQLQQDWRAAFEEIAIPLAGNQ